jgi:hypothetical protein
MERRKFEKLVEQVIQQLPTEFREKLENVVVIVEDSPSDELLDRMEMSDDDTLFGLYEGTPLTERGFDTPCIRIESGFFKDRLKRSAKRTKRSGKKLRRRLFMKWRISLVSMTTTWKTSGTERELKKL